LGGAAFFRLLFWLKRNRIFSHCARHPLMDSLAKEVFYCAHSYHFEVGNNANFIGVTVHGETMMAAIIETILSPLNSNRKRASV